jgi:DNA-binding response OmpR family regulator
METALGNHSGSKILIVEDDITMEALWRYIIDVACPGSHLDWATTGEAADHLLNETEKKGSDYDLVIADIFLGGTRTGLELWERHSGSASSFLLISVLSPQRLLQLARTRETALPVYLQKPLDPTQCIETIRALLPRPS